MSIEENAEILELDKPPYGSLKNIMKSNEINKGCSLSGAEWDTIENQ
jgi:hypothetical protein